MSNVIDFLFEDPSRIINTDVYSKIISENPESICFFSLVNFQVCVVFDKRLKKYALKFRGFDTFSRYNWDKWQVHNYYSTFELARDSFRAFINEFVSRANLFFNGFEEIRRNELPF